MEFQFQKSKKNYPLTTGMTIALLVSYVILNFLPHNVVTTYFFSYPGEFNFINWILSTFAHASVGHLLWNSLFLYVLGRAVEEKVGMGQWILFYVMAGLLSGFGDSLIRGVFLSQTQPTVGASGAISGLAVVAALRSPYTIPIGGKLIPFPVFFIAWVMIYSDLTNLFTRDNIARWSHLGGYLSVFLAAYFLDEKQRKELKIGFFLNVVFFILSLILLFFIGNR